MKLILLVGPPGAGKSTLAISLAREGFIRISQDVQGKDGHLKLFNEALESGQNIVVDRLNFNTVQRKRYLEPAKAKGYSTEIRVLHESEETCLERCMLRQGHETITDRFSAEQAIKMFFSRYERVQDHEADKVVRIWPEGFKPLAVVCDLDGTLCNVDHRLHFVRGEKKNWKGFFEGIPNDGVNGWCADIIRSMSDQYEIVYCSGRGNEHREKTVSWLDSNGLLCFRSPVDGIRVEPKLFMRQAGDSRKDSIVKEVILDFEILTRYTPYFFIDDRAQVFDMWRSRGYTCLACAKGDF